MSASWSAVIPQKDLRLAKSRMALPNHRRRRLVVAMLDDTLDAVLGSAAVLRVIIVCDSHNDAPLLSRTGVITHINRLGGGQNSAVEVGVALARGLLPGAGVAVLPADLPGLRSAALTRALDLARQHPRSFVRDASGSGTTLLTATDGLDLLAGYGPSSGAVHALSGVMEIGAGNQVESLRDDVDDLAALRAVAGRACGTRTRRAYAELVATDHVESSGVAQC